MVTTTTAPAETVAPVHSPRSHVAYDHPTVSPQGNTNGHIFRRWVYRLALLGFLATVVFLAFFASRHWNALLLSRTDVTVEPKQTIAFYAAADGGLQLERPYFAGERLEKGEQLGTINARELSRRIELHQAEISLVEQQLGELTQRRLAVEGQPLRLNLEEEVRSLEKEVELAKTKLEQLRRQREACVIRSPASGWLVEDVPQNRPLVEDEVVLRVAPVGTPMWLKIDAPGRLLDELSGAEGFRVRLLTTAGEVDCRAVRANHPIRTRTVEDEDGRREVWVSFYANVQSPEFNSLPGMRGAIVSFSP